MSPLPESGAPLLNLLVAYPYMSKALKRILEIAGPRVRFLLDSGAFTAWKLKRPIGLDDYCRFIEELPFRPWRYFALDVVGDPAATRKNYEAMLARGFTPVPIFTRGEDIKVLEFYYETSDVVAVGGLVGTSGAKGFVNGIMPKIGKRKAHLLGFTHLDFLKVHRPYMCDSSTWDNVPRYGVLTLYLGRGKIRQFNKRLFARRPKPELWDAIASYGVDPRSLAKEAAWGPTIKNVARKLSAHSAVRLSEDVEKNLGTMLFNAAGSQETMEMLLEAYDKIRGTP